MSFPYQLDNLLKETTALTNGNLKAFKYIPRNCTGFHCPAIYWLWTGD